MFHHIIPAFIAVAVLASTTARAERELPCPQIIKYSNGSYLKAGNEFYYPDGTYMKSGSRLYHPSGSTLKSGRDFFYSNGNRLNEGLTLFYPDGSTLKGGPNMYYGNGTYLRSGSKFFHENGAIARSGTTLYHPDGSVTAFPVILTAVLGTEGFFRAEVGTDYENLDLTVDNLISSPFITSSSLDVTPELEVTGIRIVITSGEPNENVALTMSADGDYTCAILGSQPSAFSIDAAAATVEVRVKDGYDPRTVRDALRQVLDSL
jgi:hypothetical protein